MNSLRSSPKNPAGTLPEMFLGRPPVISQEVPPGISLEVLLGITQGVPS